ncbi:MAG: hypothetical protein JXN59_15620 [Anaerolineae bacterium]|nr:hypothetical protein [Anaerolineae bacterium]
MTFSDPDNPRDDRLQDELNNYGYGHAGPGPLRGGGLLGWLGRSARRSTEHRARRWVYWNVPFFRSWQRYRRAGRLGRAGCVVRLLIQVAILTVMGYVMFQLAGSTGVLESMWSTIQGALP